MAEQTFIAPNFYEREIDKSQPVDAVPVGTPAGVIGTANKGPAFVPLTVRSMDQFVSVFGNLDVNKQGPYAVNEFLKHRTALTYLRVLGAGANTTTSDIDTTTRAGRVKNAGVYLYGASAADDSRGRHTGAVQFLTARHSLRSNEAYGMPMFTDNSSFNGSTVNLVRGMVLLASGTRMMILDGNESSVGVFTAAGPDDAATISSGLFKLVLSSSNGASFGVTDGASGVRIFSASLDPSSKDYFAKILNTDPQKFSTEQHLLYADFPVDDELATATTVGVLSGSTLTSANSGDASMIMRQRYGSFDTRYSTPKTPVFISQPFGATEYDLFYFESLDDGAYANNLYKISITNIKASVDDSNKYGSFTVQIRDWNDTDINQQVLESFPDCNLDPYSERYIGKVIGDRKVSFNFDATSASERRHVVSGKYNNKSKYVRVIIDDAVDRALVPEVTLPFGFRGVELLKTNDSLNDTAGTTPKIVGVMGTGVASALSGAILPPIPFRVKVTKGDVSTAGTFVGQPGPLELASPQFYWGVKFEKNNDPLNCNVTSEKNNLLESYTKFLGIKKLDTLVTGSGADTFCNNKFTLSKVAFSNTSLSHLTSSVNDHMREAAYLRKGTIDTTSYTISSSIGRRITLATLLSSGTAAEFNRFTTYAKFTTFMYGGYDGLNFLDKNAQKMNDLATSFDASGGAEGSYVAPGLLVNPNGVGQTNSNVASYVTAIDIMTDPMVVNTNLLAIPGIREPFLTDYAMRKSREYGMAYYMMDIPGYDDGALRIYDDSTNRLNVDYTAAAVDSRAIDNNYAGVYFPSVWIDDAVNKRRVKVAASVAALGAIAFNDLVAYPWFAPAGFNRAALDFVKNVEVRLDARDRDRLQLSRINPIAVFPKLGFVVYGQRTLQIAKSALDRVNVRRLLLEVKRLVIEIALKLTFEQNNKATRDKFFSDSTLRLGLVQAQSGIEKFQVICNDSNNTTQDVELNKMNGKIVIWPTKTFEFIALDFVITTTGVEFL
jgi:hypothetical protein